MEVTNTLMVSDAPRCRHRSQTQEHVGQSHEHRLIPTVTDGTENVNTVVSLDISGINVGNCILNCSLPQNHRVKVKARVKTNNGVRHLLACL